MSRRVRIRVIPNASRDAVAGWQEGVLRVKLQAVPEGGRANRALIAFLSRELGCHRREIRILSGETSRNKVVEVPEQAALPG
jgi:uncharacterized protein (TIGR00251 family)